MRQNNENKSNDLDEMLCDLAIMAHAKDLGRKFYVESQKQKAVIPPDPRVLALIQKSRDRTRRKQALTRVYRFARRAAVVFLCVFILTTATFVVSADFRETLYRLLFQTEPRYTQVTNDGDGYFINPEVFDWSGAYAPTYLPEGYWLADKDFSAKVKLVKYHKGGDSISFSQLDFQNGDFITHIDTEDADYSENLEINGGNGLLVVKGESAQIVWKQGPVLLKIIATVDEREELIKMARGIKPINKNN